MEIKSTIRTSVLIALIFGIVFWIVDAFYEYLMFERNFRFMLFQEPLSFLDSLYLNIPPHALLNRLSFMGACIIGGILVGILIIQYKKRDYKLRESEERFRNIAESAEDYIFSKNMERAYTFVNPAMARLLQREQEEVIGKTPEDVFTPEGAAVVNAVDKDAFNGMIVNRVEAMTIGEVQYYFHVVQGPMKDRDGHIIGITGIVRDVTNEVENEQRRKSLDEQMQQSQKLESLGVLAGGIAHDFNNLLLGILGNADLALDEISATSELRPYLSDIELAAKRAADLCRQMLAYSGHGRFVIQPINLNQVITEMERLLSASLSKMVKVNYLFQEDLPLISADVSQIRQIVMNLLTNASEAIANRDGVITVTTTMIDFKGGVIENSWLKEPLPTGQYVVLTVEDNGCGMDEETMQRIFDPFYTRKFTGRGLGLASVLGIVRGHRGTICVESTIDKGTTFKVVFPVAKKEDDVKDKPVKKGDRWKGSGKILLVDDEEHVLRVAKKMLQKGGFDVITASNGVEALALFRKQHADIKAIILDLTMPQMDGETAMHKLQEIDPAVSIMIASGFSEQDIKSRFVGEQLGGFIHKPYRYGELMKQLKQIIHHEKN